MPHLFNKAAQGRSMSVESILLLKSNMLLTAHKLNRCVIAKKSGFFLALVGCARKNSRGGF